MRSPARTLRRAGAVLAAAGAAALSVTAVAAATTHPAAVRSPLRACTAAKLTTWMGVPGSGTAGTFYYDLQFSNTSRTTCTLRGYPTARPTRDGDVVGPASRHDTLFRIRTVVLRPGQTAHAVLGIVDAGAACPGSEVRANGLKVFAPGTSVGTPVSFGSFQVCHTPSVLRVRVVRPGPGIPGYSQ